MAGMSLSPLVAMVSAILAFSNSAVVRWFSSTITGLPVSGFTAAARGWTRTWYGLGMAPKVAELRSLASDDKRRRSPQIDSQHCANLASPYPIANRSLLCAPFPNDAALLQPHFVHFVGFVFIPTHSRAICSWNSSAVFGGHGQTHSLGAVDRFDSSWIAGLPLPTPLRVRDATSSWWVRAANRVVANLQEELRTAAAGLDS